MKCGRCGNDNPDDVRFCRFCGITLGNVTGIPGRDSTAEDEVEDRSQVDAVVAVAINVRRIFILMLIAAIVMIGANMLSLYLSNADVDYDEARNGIMVFGVLSTTLLIIGAIYAVRVKRVTRL